MLVENFYLNFLDAGEIPTISTIFIKIKLTIIQQRYRINNQIRSQNVRLIDEKNNHIGIVSTAEAVKIARERNYDLVEISPKAAPPVAKLLNFGQFKYDLKKKEQGQKIKQKKTELKGIRLSFRIGKGDLEVRSNQAKKFLSQGNKVKIEMILKGREKAHFDLAKEIVKHFIENLGEVNIEQPISRQGGKLISLVSAK